MMTTAILYFNKPSLTARCIASIRQSIQNGVPEQHHLLLIDNGSQQVGTFEARMKAEQLRLSTNVGFSSGMNHALRAIFSKGDARIAVLFSNDVFPSPDFHQQLEKLVESSPSRPVIYCPHVFHSIASTKPAYTHGLLDLSNYGLSHAFSLEQANIRFPEYYPAAVTIWTRLAFEKTGGFDERFFCYWEDVELSHRCSRLDVDLLSMPALKVHHLGRGTTRGNRTYSVHFREGRELLRQTIAGSPGNQR